MGYFKTLLVPIDGNGIYEMIEIKFPHCVTTQTKVYYSLWEKGVEP